jgi:hypothetical protein
MRKLLVTVVTIMILVAAMEAVPAVASNKATQDISITVPLIDLIAAAPDQVKWTTDAGYENGVGNRIIQVQVANLPAGMKIHIVPSGVFGQHGYAPVLTEVTLTDSLPQTLVRTGTGWGGCKLNVWAEAPGPVAAVVTLSLATPQRAVLAVGIILVMANQPTPEQLQKTIDANGVMTITDGQ